MKSTRSIILRDIPYWENIRSIHQCTELSFKQIINSAHQSTLVVLFYISHFAQSKYSSITSNLHFTFIFYAHDKHNFQCTMHTAHIRNFTQKKSIWREYGTLRKIEDGMPHVSDRLNDKYSTAMLVYFVWWMRSHSSAAIVSHYLFSFLYYYYTLVFVCLCAINEVRRHFWIRVRIQNTFYD